MLPSLSTKLVFVIYWVEVELQITSHETKALKYNLSFNVKKKQTFIVQILGFIFNGQNEHMFFSQLT